MMILFDIPPSDAPDDSSPLVPATINKTSINKDGTHTKTLTYPLMSPQNVKICMYHYTVNE